MTGRAAGCVGLDGSGRRSRSRRDRLGFNCRDTHVFAKRDIVGIHVTGFAVDDNSVPAVRTAGNGQRGSFIIFAENGVVRARAAAEADIHRVDGAARGSGSRGRFDCGGLGGGRGDTEVS